MGSMIEFARTDGGKTKGYLASAGNNGPGSGITHKELADPAKIKVPFQGHFANQDDWCTPAAVDTLESAMKAAGAAPEIYRYDAAHAFFNERSAAYDLASANQAWERTAAF